MISKDLIAASSEPILLSILSSGEDYGYAIIQKVRVHSGNQLKWSEGMLYPVLHRLENQGRIKSRWATGENGRRRKNYRITARGKKTLERQKEHWEAVHATLITLWGKPVN